MQTGIYLLNKNLLSPEKRRAMIASLDFTSLRVYLPRREARCLDRYYDLLIPLTALRFDNDKSAIPWPSLTHSFIQFACHIRCESRHRLTVSGIYRLR